MAKQADFDRRLLASDVPNSEPTDFKVGDEVLALGMVTGIIEAAAMSKHGVGMLYTVRAFDDENGKRTFDNKTVDWRADELEPWTGR